MINLSKIKEPYIISEIGSNHNGDMKLCERLIKKSKEAGANAVKFQLFTINSLFSETCFKNNKLSKKEIKKYTLNVKNIKFIVNIHEVLTGKLVASAEKDIAGNIIKETGRIMKPENFEQAYSDRLEFLRDEVISGGLMLEAWTNKGNENLIYTKGETLTVNVRVNMPSYIRFIYHLADGSRVLLLNNYYINQSKVNQVYPIPNEFICASPFGAEFLQVFAQTEEFEKLATVDIDGYTILKEDLAKLLTKTRGFKKKKPELMQTENRLIITTMEE